MFIVPRRSWRAAPAAILAAALLCPNPASAQSDDLQSQVKTCSAETSGANPVTAKEKIAACSVLLQSGKLTTRGTADVYVWRSLGYYAKGDPADGLADLDAAVTADPTDPNAWAQSCSAHTWSGNQTARAIRECTTAIHLAPNQGTPWTFRGDIYLTQHNYPLAIADYNRAITLSPTWMWPWDNRGEAYLRSGNLKHALADFQQVIKLNPDYAMGYLDSGIAHIKTHDLSAAVSDFNAALKVTPKNPESLYGRGIARILQGDRAGGKADIAAAKALYPKVARMFDEDGVRAP